MKPDRLPVCSGTACHPAGDQTGDRARRHPRERGVGRLDLERGRGVRGRTRDRTGATGGEQREERDREGAHGLVPGGYARERRTAIVRRDQVQAAPAGGASRRSPSCDGMQKDTRVPPPGSGSAQITPPCSIDDLPGEVQPDADAGLLLAQGRLARGERLAEGLRHHAAVEPVAAVGDRHDDAFVEQPGDELDGPAHGGVPAGVVQELVHDAADPTAVGDRHERVGDLGLDRRGRVAAPDVVDRVADQRPQVGGGQVERERPALELGERDDLVDDPHERIERVLQLLEELLALHLGHARVPQHVGDPLRDRHRRPELVGDVREEVGLRGRALGHVLAQGLQLVLEVAHPQDGAADLVGQQVRGAGRERHPTGLHGADRGGQAVQALGAQQVGGGARGERGRDHRRVGDVAADDHPRRGGRGLHPAHHLGPADRVHVHVGHDDVGSRARGGLHRTERVRGHLDDEVGRLAQQVVLQPRDLVGSVADQGVGRHLSGYRPNGGPVERSG